MKPINTINELERYINKLSDKVWRPGEKKIFLLIAKLAYGFGKEDGQRSEPIGKS
jgi:hypothetical protein